MKRSILFKVKGDFIASYCNMKDAIKEAESMVYYGVFPLVFCYDEKGKVKPYYYKNIALQISDKNITELKEYYNR